MYPRLSLNLKLLIVLLLLPSAGITGIFHLVLAVLGIERRASCVPGQALYISSPRNYFQHTIFFYHFEVVFSTFGLMKVPYL